MVVKNYEAFIKLTNKIELQKERTFTLRKYHAKNEYHKRIMNGDWSVIVPEWNDDDLWEKYEQEIIDSKNKIKGEIYMSKERVLIRLSKDFHNVEFECSDIDPNIEDIREIRQKGLEFLMETVSMLPSELKSTKQSTPATYTKKDYAPKQPTNYPSNGKVTLDMITTQFIKGKQKSIALGKINKGELSLEALNNSSSWDETQSLVFGK
jgi:hypothetical protein